MRLQFIHLPGESPWPLCCGGVLSQRQVQAMEFLTRLESRVHAALLLDAWGIERLEINRLHDSGHASPNRLKTGLQTNEATLAAASDSPSTLQPLNGQLVPASCSRRRKKADHPPLNWWFPLTEHTR